MAQSWRLNASHWSAVLIRLVLAVLFVAFTLGAESSCVPKPVFTADPTGGVAPLFVQFDATQTQTADKKNVIKNYAWDFNDDGVADASGPSLLRISHAFGIAPGNKTQDHTVRLTCADAKGRTRSTTATIHVEPSANEAVNGYSDLIPGDSTASYDPKRFAVITGEVRDAGANGTGNSPLKGVKVSIHRLNPDGAVYGSDTTDDKGRFSLPVNGGGTLTLIYELSGYLPVHRQVRVPWGEAVAAETVYLVPQEAVSAPIALNAATAQTTRASDKTDASGARACSLVFTPGTQATAVNAQGDTVQPSQIAVRATEYTVGPNGPSAMPALLPPTTAYTYCVELQAEEANGQALSNVTFNKPVITWVNNFLNIPVGRGVPVGYYNQAKAVWEGSEDGLVVRLLHINTGPYASDPEVVNAMDANADGVEDLWGYATYYDAVAGLQDKARYHPGETYWRIKLTHFSTYDFNWPFGLPADAIVFNPNWKYGEDGEKPQSEFCGIQVNSFVNERSQTFHEDIPIKGTNLSLHYASSRVEDFQHRIRIPITANNFPASLEKIIIKVEVAGRLMVQEKLKGVLIPNDFVEFVWDGTDFRGTRLNGSATAHISIGYAYKPYYSRVNGDLYIEGTYYETWAQAGRFAMDIDGRDYAIAWWRENLEIDLAPKGTLAEGWTISNHHYLSTNDPSNLYKGDGTIVRDKASIIYRYAGLGGTGSGGYNGDIDPNSGSRRLAWEAKLNSPAHIALDGKGNLYIADSRNNRIRKVDTNGYIWTVAGSGNWDHSDNVGDGGPAVSANLAQPEGVAVDTAGNIYIADTMNYRIRQVDTNGIITTIMGRYMNCYPCISGNGGPASDATLCESYGIDVDEAGNIIFTDRNSIRRISPDKIVNAIITGDEYFIPPDVEVDGTGNIYLSSCGLGGCYVGNIIRYDPSGTPLKSSPNLSTHLMGLGLDLAGNTYVATGNIHKVVKLDADMNISPVAGTGSAGFSNKTVSVATELPLNYPYDVAVDPSGNIYISDQMNNCVWKIVKSSAAFSAMGGGDIQFVEDGTGYIMDKYGKHLKTVDLDTGAVLSAFEYDAATGELTAITDRFGDRTVIQRSGTTVDITAHAGKADAVTTRLTLNSRRQITKVAYPDNSAYTFAYTNGGLMNDAWDPKNNHFIHRFDACGRVYQTEDPLSGTATPWQFARQVLSGQGIVATTVTTPQGNVTTYDDKFLTTGAFTSTITGPAGDTTTYTRGADGLHIDKVTPCGTTLAYDLGYDGNYRYNYLKKLVETTGGRQRTTEWAKAYLDTDNNGEIDLIQADTTVNTRVFGLDTNVPQNLRTLTTPQGRTVTTGYDPITLLTTSRGVAGLNPVTYQYTYENGATGRPTQVTAVSGTRRVVTGLNYAARMATAAVSDTSGAVSSITRYSYDIMDRLRRVEELDPVNGTTVVHQVRYTYDANGNLAEVWTPRAMDDGQLDGNLLSHIFNYNGVNLSDLYDPPAVNPNYVYGYDRDRNLTTVTLPSGARIVNTWQYGRLEKIEAPGIAIDPVWECGGKLDSIARGAEQIGYTWNGALLAGEAMGGTLQGRSIGYTYTNDFALEDLTYAGATTRHGYDNDDLLTSAGTYAIARSANNGLPESVSGNGLSLARSFNAYGELSGEGASIGGASRYAWGATDYYPDGRIKARTETIGGTYTYEYAYDAAGRLRRVTRNGTAMEEYEYYPSGGRKREINRYPHKFIDRGFNYGDDDRMSAAGATTYTYSDDGFLATKTRGGDVTTYTYNALGELTAVDLPGTTQDIAYVHDALGRRVARQAGGVTTDKYLWQGQTRLLAVYGGDDALKYRFEYADSRMPVAMTNAGGQRYYLLYDQVGSLRLVTDASGNLVKQIDYDSFGGIIGDSNPSLDVPFGFAGGLSDKATGFVRFGCRDYDPDTGRWTAKDPILFSGGDTNLYGYCLNDPVNFVDPIGLNRSKDGLTYNDDGNIIGETGLESPNPFLDPINYISGSGAGALKWLNRPYWRYVGPNSNPCSPWMTRGNGWKPPYGNDFNLAKDALQMPYKPNDVIKIRVPWYKPVRGPRPVSGNDQWGPGGGTEYAKGWRWPN